MSLAAYLASCSQLSGLPMPLSMLCIPVTNHQQEGQAGLHIMVRLTGLQVGADVIADGLP